MRALVFFNGSLASRESLNQACLEINKLAHKTPRPENFEGLLVVPEYRVIDEGMNKVLEDKSARLLTYGVSRLECCVGFDHVYGLIIKYQDNITRGLIELSIREKVDQLYLPYASHEVKPAQEKRKGFFNLFKHTQIKAEPDSLDKTTQINFSDLLRGTTCRLILSDENGQVMKINYFAPPRQVKQLELAS
jgi:hypothetical protein